MKLIELFSKIGSFFTTKTKVCSNNTKADVVDNTSKWMWLPLSLAIFGIDLIQRGLSTFAKMKDFGIPDLQNTLSMYFIVMSISVLVCGYFCDNFNSRKILLWSTIAGAIGILSLPYFSLGFILIFGAAAAFIKIAPFTAPLKLKNGNESLRIAPQAAAKNIGGALFILLLGTVLPIIGWGWSVSVLALLFLIAGISAYRVLPNDKLEGWKWSIFLELARDYKFWMVMVYFFFMNGLYYIAIKGFIPSLMESGLSKSFSISLVAISFLCAGVLRFFWGWLGTKKIKKFAQYTNVDTKFPLMVIGTIGMGLCIPVTLVAPITSLILFTIMSAIHTPIYWAWCKEQWGPVYISTVLSIGFSVMYLGSGIMYGTWVG